MYPVCGLIIGRKILYLVLTIKAFKMKKILMTLAVAFVAIAANAQFMLVVV